MEYNYCTFISPLRVITYFKQLSKLDLKLQSYLILNQKLNNCVWKNFVFIKQAETTEWVNPQTKLKQTNILNML